ncbi:MAG: acetate--CoA ligase [Phycisphaeraceae bacterium]|nr:acetate--CoA ligase [Phycisphaeraceae bacterium]
MTTSPSQPGPSGDIDSVLNETRLFQPPSAAELGLPGGAQWLVPSIGAYREMHRRSIEQPGEFWGSIAKELHWFTPWTSVVSWSPPDARWFDGATTNIAYNCLERQIQAGLGDRTAILWEGEPVGPSGPEVRRLSYRDLLCESSKLANALKAMGVRKGQVVTIYMGMVPELPIALLACARIGAPHSVIFGGFSAHAIADRLTDASSRTVITCDGAWRRGKVVPLKENVDAAVSQLEKAKPGAAAVDHVICLKRCGNTVEWNAGRDRWWHDVVDKASDQCPAERMNSEDMLFLLYTSGSTGKPKGIVHTTGGYMVHVYATAKYAWNFGDPAGAGGDAPLYWCTADIGWVTGHSYILYGILPNRVTSLMFEGAPNFPAEDRFWDIVERHRVTHFYTAPTAIRAFMKWGEKHPKKHDLSSLRILGTVGEPINPEAWMWYREHIGADRCPIVDTWWQTETGGFMIAPLPGAMPTKPGSCTLPFFGVDAAVVNEQGHEVGANKGGLLVIRRPWPGIIRGVHGDRDRFVQTYFSRVRDPATGQAYYFTGDGARRDADGYFWVMGRIDDVINVAGHRLGTMEIESALVSHPAVVEAAVVGMPHDIKGTGIAAFVTLGSGQRAGEDLRAALLEHVSREIGPIARPDSIRFTDALPKTRSGKIMRRLLRDIASGVENIRQDTTTLEDYSILAKLRGDDES